MELTRVPHSARRFEVVADRARDVRRVKRDGVPQDVDAQGFEKLRRLHRVWSEALATG